MIVCHCRRVSDRVIRECVRNGCADVEEVSGACGAATHCGGCSALVEDVVHEELSRGGVVATGALTRRVA